MNNFSSQGGLLTGGVAKGLAKAIQRLAKKVQSAPKHSKSVKGKKSGKSKKSKRSGKKSKKH